MTRLNLNDASLLDISGELGPIARNRLHAHLNATPAAKADYNTLAGRYSLLRSLPQPDLSEAEKARIAANLKAAIHAHLDRQTHGKQALRRAKLIHYALASLSAAAAAAVVTAGVILLSPGKPKAPTETAGRVSHVVDRLAAYDSSPGTYEQALDDVESSVRQLQAEGSSVSGQQTQEMTPLLEALASLPANPAVEGAVDELEVPQGGM